MKKYEKLLELLNKKYSHLGRTNLNNIIEKFFQFIAQELKKGNKVEIRKFGVFKRKEIGPKKVYIPKKNSYITQEKTHTPHFKNSDSFFVKNEQ
jgi:nucleoid DNA-binding protein